jgi:hypothetical protein
MMAEKTRFGKNFVKIKDNPVLAVIIALGVIVIALSSFTNAARNLLGLLSKEKERANVTGTWKTRALTNQFNPKQKWTFTPANSLVGNRKNALQGSVLRHRFNRRD